MQKGFTLLELLITIGIISIIFAAILVGVDPNKRFREARDTERYQEVTTILEAAKVDYVDNDGSFIAAILGLTPGNIAMVGTASSGCDVKSCPDVTVDNSVCVDLTGLVSEGYIESVPVAPEGSVVYDATQTGYYLSQQGGILTVGACESEEEPSIELRR